MICLDTNVVIAVINRRPSRIREKLERALLAGQEVGIPAIVLFEMWYGIAKSRRAEESAANLARFLTLNVVVVSFDEADAQEAGDIRAVLAQSGTPIGPYDVLIAAQARRRDAVLVTANAREFSRVPGLKTEDWALTSPS